jgi:hypothetical protein
MQPIPVELHLDIMFANIIEFRGPDVKGKMQTGRLRKRSNETGQYPIRRAQEPRLAKSAWLAPHSKFVVVKIWKSDWKLLPALAIAANREIWFALCWRL